MPWCGFTSIHIDHREAGNLTQHPLQLGWGCKHLKKYFFPNNSTKVVGATKIKIIVESFSLLSHQRFNLFCAPPPLKYLLKSREIRKNTVFYIYHATYRLAFPWICFFCFVLFKKTVKGTIIWMQKS